MRLIYNRDYLFKGVPKTKHQIYFGKVLEFAKDVSSEKDILSSYIIQKYSIKKMNGTKGIFKFDLQASDGSRCLIKYEERDQQIFGDDPGIALLRIVSHDEQGEIGRQIEKAFVDYSRFIEYDDDTTGDDSHIDETLGREYMRTLFIYPEMSEDDFLAQLLDEDSKYVYKPSEKQYFALESQGPLLMLGCAGSGKSLVEVSKALKNAHSVLNQAYFTFTTPLKEMAEKIYRKYSQSPKIKGDTKFYSIINYSLDQLGISVKNYFGFERYKAWIYEDRIISKYTWIKDVGIVNLWIEIRGLIKGFMGKDYFRNLTIKNASHAFNSKQIEELTSKGILEKEKHSATSYLIIKSDELYRFIKPYPDLRNFMFHHDFDTPLIDRSTYQNLKDEYSRFSKDKRTQIYEFVANVYQKHLNEENLLDDNDLARLNILKNYQLMKSPLDYVLVDEVQDLSEMQIYMLIDLATNPQFVFLSGDVSQVINPTFFQKGRSGVLFRNRKNYPWDRSNVITLNENYRNSKSIVDVANRIVEIRQSILGTYTEDIVEISRELVKTEGLPVFVETPEEIFIEALASWQDAARVAIIVSGEESKKNLIKKMSLGKTEAYNIFTVQEAKGLEFDRVAIYNVLSDHKEAWSNITDSTQKLSNTHYQYYFNLFYVAVTRAKRNLFLFEKEKNLEIVQKMTSVFESVTNNLFEVMDPAEFISEEMIIKQAQEFFKAENYERARMNYLRVSKRRDALICKGYSLIQMAKFEQGVKLLYRFKEHHDYAYTFSDSKDTLLLHILMGYRLKKLSAHDVTKLLNKRSMIDLVQPYKNDSNYEDILAEVIHLNGQVNRQIIEAKIKEIRV